MPSRITTLSLVALSLSGTSLGAPVPFLDSIGGFLSDNVLAPAADFVQENIVEPAKEIINAGDVVNTAAATLLSQPEIDSFVSVAQFARASFCSAPVVLEWACGEACDANPETEVVLAGGDDEQIPGFFVAFDPPTNSMVVAHQGTNRNSVDSIINDIDLFLDPPLENRFPGATAAGVEIHGGFQDAFEETATQVLDAVQQGIAERGATNVIVTGHSLGAAISLLEMVHLHKVLDPAITIQTTVFGLPRAGNQQWADFVDATVASRPGSTFQFFVNDVDPVPKVPPIELGFRHPSGEIFQKNGTTLETLRCPGQENENCATGISLFDSDADFHKGPYAGVFLGSKFCTI